ncbi:MAG: hypothetical protein ACE5HE_01690 [Phycisphaerae bacterium]
MLLLSLVAAATAFTGRLGRATLCTDSYQYVASAEALLDPVQIPHFETRKPGYPFFLAGVKLAFGQLGWVAVVCHYALLVLLPLAAYGMGIHLHSRLLGWMSAVLTMAQLQGLVFSNWMMSETLYTLMLSFALLVFFVGLQKPGGGLRLCASGSLLGAAWFTRGVAVAVIPVALVAVAIVHRHRPRRAAALCTAFVFPLLGFFLLECSLNLMFSGQFRASTGTGGSCLWAHRMRVFQGAGFPETADGVALRSLLPERSEEEAYTANCSDQWVAFYRAVHDNRWSEWAFDETCLRTAFAAIRAAPTPFALYSTKLALWHLFRHGDGMELSPVPETHRAGLLLHPYADARLPNPDPLAWNAYWSVPHLSRDESVRLIERTKTEAARRAPFAGTGIWSALRYWKTLPVVVAVVDVMTRCGDLWPGFALLLCGFLGLNRATCYTLAAAYIAEAILLGAMTITNSRYQTVWVVFDTTLAAAVPAGVVAMIAAHLRAWKETVRAERSVDVGNAR